MNAKHLIFLAAMAAGLIPGICYRLTIPQPWSPRWIPDATLEESMAAPASHIPGKMPEAWVEECRAAESIEAKTACVASVAGWKSMDFQKAADTALPLPGENRRAVLGLLIPLWAAAHGTDCITWLAARTPAEIGLEYQLTQLGESALQTWLAADTAGFYQWMTENRKAYPPLEDWRIHGIVEDWMPHRDSLPPPWPALLPAFGPATRTNLSSAPSGLPGMPSSSPEPSILLSRRTHAAFIPAVLPPASIKICSTGFPRWIPRNSASGWRPTPVCPAAKTLSCWRNASTRPVPPIQQRPLPC